MGIQISHINEKVYIEVEWHFTCTGNLCKFNYAYTATPKKTGHKHHLNITEDSMKWAYPHQVSVRWETWKICEVVPVAFHGVSTSWCWMQSQFLRLLLIHLKVYTTFFHTRKSLCQGKSSFWYSSPVGERCANLGEEIAWSVLNWTQYTDWQCCVPLKDCWEQFWINWFLLYELTLKVNSPERKCDFPVKTYVWEVWGRFQIQVCL